MDMYKSYQLIFDLPDELVTENVINLLHEKIIQVVLE